MSRRTKLIAAVALLAAGVGAVGTGAGVLLTLNGGSRLTRNQAEEAVAQVRSSHFAPGAPLGARMAPVLPRSVGIYRDHWLRVGPGNLTWVKVESAARRIGGSVEVTLRMRFPDFRPQIGWWRWKLLPSGKVTYEGAGGSAIFQRMLEAS